MIKTLYANGCSWTAGNGIFEDPDYVGDPDSAQDWKKYAWPAEIGRLNNLSVVNDSAGGGSNERIFRKTLAYIQQLSEQDRNETLVMLGLTSLDRGEIYVQPSAGGVGRWCRFNVSQAFSSYEEHTGWEKKRLKAIDAAQQSYVAEIYNDYHQAQKFFDSLFMLVNTLENLKISHLLFMALSWQWYIPDFAVEEFRVKSEKYSTFKGVYQLDTNMHDYILKNKLPLSSCIHPLISGQKSWAEALNTELHSREIL
jgi:hypothetical protein